MRFARPAVATALAALLASATPSAGQGREPLGGWAIDVRTVTASVPTTAGWTPPLPSGSVLPSRGFGVDGGVDLFVGPGRHRRLSAGLRGFAVQGRTSGTSGGATVTTRAIGGAPHVAVNFGHRHGWSYLSVGAGGVEVTSNVGDVRDDPGGTTLAFHYGGGARWFLRDRLALSLDLRFWALTPRAASATRSAAAATTRVLFAAGLALR